MAKFLRIFEGGGNLAQFLSMQKAPVDAALADAGALLFRGFEVPDAEAFDAVVQGYGEPGFTYQDSLSNAVRMNVTERVFTANEAPRSTEIHLHHEMAQTPLFPSKLFFFCEIAPQSGGATPVCRSDWLLKEMNDAWPKLVERFEESGVRYTNVMPGEDDASSGQGRSWRSTLAVETREDAERRLAALDYEWQWREDDSLRATTPILPAMRTLPDGRKTFFNQLIAAFRGWSDSRNRSGKSVTFGDNTPITIEDMTPVIELAERLTRDINWQAGDVALLDNYLVMHGRRPFEGQRRVLASLIR